MQPTTRATAPDERRPAPRHGDLDTTLDTCLRAESAAGSWTRAPLALAYSGGTDSTALLLSTLRALARLPERARPTALLMLHVNHGLQPAAHDFVRHGASVCEALKEHAAVPLTWTCQAVQVPQPAGASVEHEARKARYRALADMARAGGAKLVLLGHQADDQAESILLALARGAGLPGLAGMPQRFERHGVTFARPLLGLGRQRIVRWLKPVSQYFGVEPIDDPSNADDRYTRNRLRRQVLPQLEQWLPGFARAAARSARHAAEAQGLLDELARQDWLAVHARARAAAQDSGPARGAEADAPATRPTSPEQLTAPTAPSAPTHLQLTAFAAAVPRARWANALRYWLREAHAATAASSAQIDALCAQIETAQRHGAPRRLRLRVAGGFVVRRGDLLQYHADPATPGPLQDPSRIEGLP